MQRIEEHKSLCRHEAQPLKFGSDMECPFMPAAFHNNDKYKVYGDVNLGLNMSKGVVSGGGSSHTIYSAHVLNRMATSGDRGHIFPVAFDQHIMKHGNMTTPASRNGGAYNLYSMSGSIGGTTGTYTVGVRPHTTASGNTINVVTHRAFYGDRK